LKGVINLKFLQNRLEFKLEIQTAKQKIENEVKQKKGKSASGPKPTSTAHQPAHPDPSKRTILVRSPTHRAHSSEEGAIFFFLGMSATAPANSTSS
jgi:hypothetical protein